MKKIVLFGATGNIGAYFTDYCKKHLDAEKYEVIAGNPGKVISDVRNIKNKITNEPVYPWRDHFKRAMPWKESDFNTWYMSLDNEELKKYKLDFIS